MTKAPDLLAMPSSLNDACRKLEWADGELTRLRSQLAAAEAERDTLIEAYAACSRAIGRRGTEEIELADQITNLVAQLQAMRKALEENEEYWKSVHDLIESARETVRLKIVYDKRPPGLFQNLQNAVYICRGRNVEALRSLTEGAEK